MTLEKKIDAAKLLLATHVTKATVLYCSFGKDSMVMLHLARSLGLDLPIIFNRIPALPVKQRFANQMIEQWNLKVCSYPPVRVEIASEPTFDVVYQYTMADGKTLLMPVGVREPKPNEPFLCGLMDIVRIPCGGIWYAWDTALFGNKSCDVHPFYGEMPLVDYTTQFSRSLTGVFPLRDFTNQDVWDYTERFSVPYNTERYDAANGYREFSDQAFSDDYFPACTNCLKPGPALVDCPKFGKARNVSGELPHAVLTRLPYMAEVGEPTCQ